MSGAEHDGPPELPSLAVLAERLAPESRRASGGAVAALAAALAADLVAQVAERSGEWPERGGALAQADALRDRAVVLGDGVASAYRVLVAALDAAVAERRDPLTSGVLGAELSAAADLLLEIAEVAADAAELALLVSREGDTVVRADAAAAAVLATASADVAAHLVAVNLLTSEQDERTTHARRLAADAAASRAAAVDVS